MLRLSRVLSVTLFLWTLSIVAIAQGAKSTNSRCEFLLAAKDQQYMQMINQLVEDPNYNPMKPFSDDQSRLILESELSVRELLFGSSIEYLRLHVTPDALGDEDKFVHKLTRRTNEKIYFMVRKSRYMKLAQEVNGASFSRQIQAVDSFYRSLRKDLGLSTIEYSALEVANAFSEIYESFTDELGFSGDVELVFFGSVPNGKARLGHSDWDYVFGQELEFNYLRLQGNEELKRTIEKDMHRFSNSAEAKISNLFALDGEPQDWVNSRPDSEYSALKYLTHYNPLVFRIGPDFHGFEVQLQDEGHH